MKWRICRRRFDPPPVTADEVAQARERTEKGVARTRALDPEVRDIAARLKIQRTENHFGPLIWQALTGEGGADV